MIHKTPGCITPPRFNVRMRLAHDEHRPAGTWVCLSVHGRIAWSKRTAEKHLRDVQKNPLFTEHYDAFRIEED